MPRRASPPVLSPLERLNEFLLVGDAILARPAVREGLNFSVKIEFGTGKVFTTMTSEPDVEEYRSFVMEIRKLYLESSDIHFPKVCQAAILQHGEDGPPESFMAMRKAWNVALKSGPMGYADPSRTWTPREMLDVWFNGVLFHNDRSKRQIWDEFQSTPFPALIINNTLRTLLELMAHAIARIDYLRGGPGVVSFKTGRQLSTDHS